MSGQARYRDLFRESRFRALMLADLVDGSATWAFATVMTVVVFQRTGSVTAISTFLVARWLPGLILGPFAGLVADRFDRTRVMAVSAGSSAVIMLVLAIAVRGDAPLIVLAGLAALQSIVVAPYLPALGAVLPELVPEKLLAAANGVREVTSNVTVVLGPAVGALFLLWGHPALAVVLNAVSFLIPLVVALRLGVHSRRQAAGGGVLVELGEGARALLSQRAAMVLVVACGLDTAIAGLGSVLALPISRRVGTGVDGYAYLSIGLALGSVLAAAPAGRLAARPRLASVIVGSLLVQAVPFALLLALPNPVSAFVLMVFSGAGMIVVDILAITALQRDIPGDVLGRVFGIFETVLRVFLIITTSLGGLVIAHAGLTTMLLVVGVGVPLVVMAGWPMLSAMDRTSATRTAELEPVVRLLERLDLFDGADRTTLERLAIEARPAEVPGGTVLITEGEPANDLWLLASGRLAVVATRVGELPTVTAPSYVGEIGLLHSRPRTATVTTVGDTELYRIAGDRFLAAFEGSVASPSLLAAVGVRAGRTRPRPGPRLPVPAAAGDDLPPVRREKSP